MNILKNTRNCEKKFFLSGKVYSTHPDAMQNQLDNALKKNGISTIDFLAVHVLDNIEALTNDVRKWSEKAKKLLADHMDNTGEYFCRHCGLCETANTDTIPIFDIMEMLMYSRGYGIKNMMSKKFEQIPTTIRKKIKSSDYSSAEKKCPQKMPIAKLMTQASEEFTKGAF
ncbi:MAG: hypothetical protein HKP58_18445 [Desulfatitalea sp.]|nr:hypothetical protein [Desulfatitalea sp.]NNK02397.1 hypothetical protein [Desulfatitalea sp.]